MCGEMLKQTRWCCRDGATELHVHQETTNATWLALLGNASSWPRIVIATNTTVLLNNGK